MSTAQAPGASDAPRRAVEPPRLRPARVLVAWGVGALVLLAGAALAPGVELEGLWPALAVTASAAVMNAVLPPLVAALRVPFTLALGFVFVLVADAAILVIASELEIGLSVSGFWAALLLALIVAAITVAVEVVVGRDDADVRNLALASRVARRQGMIATTDVPGIVFLEIDGLGLPVLQRALRDGHAPGMARWLASGSHRLVGWETDLSSQTGASQAGILLGGNDDIPAFRWVEKETGRLMTCSNPGDCAEIERRAACGRGLLRDGGASRGNLLSGEAEEAILTVSRMAAETRANPGYRAFFANGANATRTVVLMAADALAEVVAAARQRRRDIVPRGNRGGSYPLLRAAMCVAVRDLVAEAVICDMLRGRPAVYATFASYDEVAHHSGTERPDALDALRKLDATFMRIAAARPFAPRPYEIVVLSDHGQTQGATFRQRNGYSLEDLVRDNVRSAGVTGMPGGDENDGLISQAAREATGRGARERGPRSVTGERVVVLASGNLGLIYLMDEPRRLTLNEIRDRHPDLIPALVGHDDIGFVMVGSRHGPVVIGASGENRLGEGRVIGSDPLAPFPANAGKHLARTDSFTHCADIVVNSFYDPVLDEGCAFEELISFHGGLGGAQTQPFLLHPTSLPPPDGPLVGAVAVNTLLRDWRARLAGQAEAEPRRAHDR